MGLGEINIGMGPSPYSQAEQLGGLKEKIVQLQVILQSLNKDNLNLRDWLHSKESDHEALLKHLAVSKSEFDRLVRQNQELLKSEERLQAEVHFYLYG